MGWWNSLCVFLAIDFCRFCVVIPPQRPMTSDFEGFSIPDCIHYIYFPIFILKKWPVFPFWMFSSKQGHLFGMTRSLTGDWTRDLPHSKPALYHYAIEEAVVVWIKSFKQTAYKAARYTGSWKPFLENNRHYWNNKKRMINASHWSSME